VPGDRPERVVIGIGNSDRGDDAAGRTVARRLRDMSSNDIAIFEHDGEATSLLASFEGTTTAFLIDASQSAAPAGTVARFDASARPLPHGAFGLSTHGMGLREAVELARTLGRLPSRCVVYAIEAGSFEFGEPLTPPVAAAVDEVCDRLRQEIDGGVGSAESTHA